MLSNDDSETDDEPGVPGEDTDADGQPYFFPSNRRRAADGPSQRNGFDPRWEYEGHHTDTSVKTMCVIGEDSLGRMRVVSTDGRGIHSWLELSNEDTVKATTEDQNATGIVLVSSLDVLVAASGNNLAIFDRRTLKHLATLPTRNKVLFHLAYSRRHDELISGGSDGCHVWKLSSTRSSSFVSEPIPFKLTLLRGFQDFSEWTDRMILDESSQMLIVIDEQMLKLFDVRSGRLRNRIDNAHEAMVSAGLWFSYSEQIVTGCINGLIKIWACQHTADWDRRQHGGRRSHKSPRRGRNNWSRRTPGSSRRRRKIQQIPAPVVCFRDHTGAVTGLARVGTGSSLVVSSSIDKTLRLWDIERLTAIATVTVGWPIRSLVGSLSTAHTEHYPRLVCAGDEGKIVTMIARKVCDFLGDVTQTISALHYCPVLDAKKPREAICGDALPPSRVGRLVEGRWVNETPVTGLILVQMRQGQWGIMRESLLLPPAARDEEAKSASVADTPISSGSKQRPAYSLGAAQVQAQQHPKRQQYERDDQGLEVHDRRRQLLMAWAPLSSVTEGYTHHVLAVESRRIVCLAADTSALHVYRFGLSSECLGVVKDRSMDSARRPQVAKVGSWKVLAHVKNEKPTCMCLLPTIPGYVANALDRVVAHAKAQVAVVRFSRESDEDSKNGNFNATEPGAGTGQSDDGAHNAEAERIAESGESGIEKDSVWGEIAVGGDVAEGGGSVYGGDGIVAIGTSHGGILLVEILVGGTTLAYLEGAFARNITHVAYCHGSVDGNDAWNAGARLVCMGHGEDGAVTVRGLAFRPHLVEVFSLGLTERPTCFCVASMRPTMTTGYADGTVTVTNFAEDRICHVESAELTGEHKAEINTISFSVRYRCLCTGSTDGCLKIWGLNGQVLHTIHLQGHVRGVAFADVAGQLVVSQNYGIHRIPRCHWCPLRLLVAVEREERRARFRTSARWKISVQAKRQASAIKTVSTIRSEIPVAYRNGGGAANVMEVQSSDDSPTGAMIAGLHDVTNKSGMLTSSDAIVAEHASRGVGAGECRATKWSRDRPSKSTPSSSTVANVGDESTKGYNGDEKGIGERDRGSSIQRNRLSHLIRTEEDLLAPYCDAVVWRPKTSDGGVQGVITPSSSIAPGFLDCMASKVLPTCAPPRTRVEKPEVTTEQGLDRFREDSTSADGYLPKSDGSRPGEETAPLGEHQNASAMPVDGEMKQSIELPAATPEKTTEPTLSAESKRSAPRDRTPCDDPDVDEIRYAGAVSRSPLQHRWILRTSKQYRRRGVCTAELVVKGKRSAVGTAVRKNHRVQGTVNLTQTVGKTLVSCLPTEKGGGDAGDHAKGQIENTGPAAGVPTYLAEGGVEIDHGSNCSGDRVRASMVEARDKSLADNGFVDMKNESVDMSECGFNLGAVAQGVPSPEPPPPPRLLPNADPRRDKGCFFDAKGRNEAYGSFPGSHLSGAKQPAAEPMIIRSMLAKRHVVKIQDFTNKVSVTRARDVLPVVGEKGTVVETSKSMDHSAIRQRPDTSAMGAIPKKSITSKAVTLMAPRESSNTRMKPTVLVEEVMSSSCRGGGSGRESGIMSPCGWNVVDYDESSSTPCLSAGESMMLRGDKGQRNGNISGIGEHEKEKNTALRSATTFFPVRPSHRRKGRRGRTRGVVDRDMDSSISHRVFGGKARANVLAPSTPVVIVRDEGASTVGDDL